MDDDNFRHDQIHHQLFSHREVVEDLLRHVIRRLSGTGGPWIDQLDFETLKREPEVSTSRRLDRRVRDIVWSIHWRGSPLYLILLIEFQSQPYRFMPLRQLTYLALFYEDLVKSKRIGPGELLPPALPICLYSGDSPWRAPTRLESLIAPCPEELKRYQPRFRQLLIEELRVEIDLADLERNSAGSIFAVQQVDTEDRLLEVIEAIERWLPAAEYETLRRCILELVIEVLPPKLESAADFNLEEFTMRAKELLAQDIARNRAFERAEGRKEGRLEGRLEGQRRLLTNQLRLKFGEIPRGLLDLVAQAGGDQLEAWAAKVLTASTIDEVLV
jgi:predicted transposase YdaD